MDSEILNTIYQRRAVRKYTEEPVDRAIIEQIIDAGPVTDNVMSIG